MSSTSFLPQMATFSASSFFAAYASISALLMLIRSLIHEFIPKPARDYLLITISKIFHFRTNKLTLVFEELNATGIGRNHLYDVAEVYLGNKIISPSTDRLKVSKSSKDKIPTFRFEKGEQIRDSYNGIPLLWSFCCLESEKRRRTFDEDTGSSVSVYETRFFELSFDKKFHHQVVHSYLPYLESKYKSIKDKMRILKLHTLGYKYGGPSIFWDTTNLDHPSTFETLAIDQQRKSIIMDDLDRFLGRKEYYRRVGRAWKRGYLLYGPPGTGKSSLVAAMANHLRFDIYDLQLGNLMKDSDLRRVLLSIPNRSILLIEDIDCSVEIKDRRKSNSNNGSENGGQVNSFRPLEPQISLSGLLNFIDGLWSSCGDERIIVFTTNHKEKLDPALLRPGRMDMHIEMSYLTVEGFRILASNYLEIDFNNHHCTNHQPLISDIESMIQTNNVTPAEVAEQLMRSEDVKEALEEVGKLLMSKQDLIELETVQDVVQVDDQV